MGAIKLMSGTDVDDDDVVALVVAVVDAVGGRGRVGAVVCVADEVGGSRTYVDGRLWQAAATGGRGRVGAVVCVATGGRGRVGAVVCV